MDYTLKQKSKIVLITPGQPSTNPRLLKEAIFLSEAGYNVTVLYSFWAHWAFKADAAIIHRYTDINWIEVGGNPYNAKWSYFFSRIINKVFKYLNRFFPKNLLLAERAQLSNYYSMLRQANKIDASLFIAHNLGMLAIAGRAAKKKNVLFAFDAEDFHRGQYGFNSKEYLRSGLIENYWMPRAAYISAASPLIASAYKEATGISSTLINNVFSIRHLVPEVKPVQQPIRLFWFSQTIGHGRGLEDILLALKVVPKESFSLTLMGDITIEMKSHFNQLIFEGDQKKVELHFLEPVDPESVFAIAASYDIGLALEPGRDMNNQIALSNKIFTYLLAGNAIIFSNTPAQGLFYKSHPEIGWIYNCGDVNALVEVLKKIRSNHLLIEHCKENARHLAEHFYNWESEQKYLKNQVESVLINA